MLFNSVSFLVFLPIVFAVYWLLRKHLLLQNLFVVAASYLFYGWWDYRFLFLIAFTSLCSYLSGLLIDRTYHKRIVAGANIALNLAILAIFKYFNFFAGSLADLLSLYGIEAGFVTLHLLLPVGISFYTFQALSYTIDVYRGKISPTRDIVAFFAFISFFPQLVAGPIERSTNLLPQFLKHRTFDYGKAVDGLRQALWGFFKKIVVADTCAMGVNSVFGQVESMDSVSLAWGGVLFAVQIYCDFSGYSDIAVGVAKLFGIDLMRNFCVTYFSRDIAEFWRRWHISLTTWFRDYVYIPLGGSRCSKALVVRNTFVVFLVSGLWHGANWTFVLWGLYHALLFLPLIVAGKNRKYLSVVAENRALPTLKEAAQMAGTFILVAIGFIIFRAEDVRQAAVYFYRMFTCFEPCLPRHGKTAALWIVVLFVVEWIQRNKNHALEIDGYGISRPVRYALYYLIVVAIIVFQGEPAQFVYFQF